MDHKYEPTKHLEFDGIGLLTPSSQFPSGLDDDIRGYFAGRKEN